MLPYEWQPKLKAFAEKLGLLFFSTPFDRAGVDFLDQMNIPLYKIASFEINDVPLIRYIAKKKKPIILSTGVGDEEDIALALKVCREEGNNDISLLKCTSDYPASYEKANLQTIPDMKNRFGVRVGVSDHSMGSLVPMVAVALGATIVEKHFILSRSVGGPDAAFSMEPYEFKQMVQNVRNVEKVLGNVKYDISETERRKRRSLYAFHDIKKGEAFTEKNVRSFRPGFGLSPKYYDVVMTKISRRDFQRGDILTEDDIR